MNNKRVLFMLAFAALVFTGCGFDNMEKQASKQFGDQHFKTAIALIELHKVRFGEYPASLESIKYTGQWDQIVWSAVKYKKLDTGYELDLTNGLMSLPENLEYPAEFWQGLGLVRSNLKK
ncbi:hypothetical protein [Longitalea luteola]|uniref:hypothetical protein n=1 Tax=Longitalea luteola TaxID=2812563 RepID=UPI001A96857B|nr:hypothetical protein [Longitalea luteola]